MKYLIRAIVTIPAIILFGLHGAALLWKFGGSFRVHTFDPDKALGLLRDLHDIQNGPPLEKWKGEWEETMREVEEFLEKYEA